MSTWEQTESVQYKLAQSLLFNFSEASRLPVNSLGIGNDDQGYYVQAYLERDPTAEETARLPQELDGVRVKYHVGGPIRPA